jgi:integrase
MLHELDTRRLAKKDYAYWGTLMGIYTGARLNEVAQIMLDDIRQEEGIYYFDMNDDGDDKKLKNAASRRRVPIHDALLSRGILEYAEKLRRQGRKRLLHELTFCRKNGYGKNLGKFFNTKFLVELGMKNKQAVFHTLRHTVVTRLTQIGQDGLQAS